MKRLLSVLVLMFALFLVLDGSTLWAQDFTYLESTGIYHDYRFCTDRYEALFGACPGEVIRLDVLFKLNVILGDPTSVKFKNKTTGETYQTRDFRTDQIWSCDPDYDCAPGSEYLLPVDMSVVTGYWVVEVKYDKKSSNNPYPKKQTFSFTSTPADFSVIPPSPQGCQVIDDGSNLLVECDAVLGPPTHPDLTDCEEEETPPCVSYAVRIYDDTGTTIVPGVHSYRLFGAYDTGEYIPPEEPGGIGKAQFTIDPIDVAAYSGNKFRFEQRYEGVGGVAIGDPAFLVSRAALYDLLIPTNAP